MAHINFTMKYSLNVTHLYFLLRWCQIYAFCLKIGIPRWILTKYSVLGFLNFSFDEMVGRSYILIEVVRTSNITQVRSKCSLLFLFPQKSTTTSSITHDFWGSFRGIKYWPPQQTVPGLRGLNCGTKSYLFFSPYLSILYNLKKIRLKIWKRINCYSSTHQLEFISAFIKTFRIEFRL